MHTALYVHVMQAVNNGALCAGDFTALMANFGEIATVGAAARAPLMQPPALFLYGRYCMYSSYMGVRRRSLQTRRFRLVQVVWL